jgi:hypothetical protein
VILLAGRQQAEPAGGAGSSFFIGRF